jgi:hypothetical protein
LGAAEEGFCTLEAEDEMTSRSKSMIDTVKWLLDANPDTINARDQQGATVFSYVVKSRAVGIAGILAAVKVLLDARLRSLTLDPIHDEKPDQVDARTATTATSTLYPSWISPQSISVYLDNKCYPSGVALHERCWSMMTRLVPEEIIEKHIDTLVYGCLPLSTRQADYVCMTLGPSVTSRRYESKLDYLFTRISFIPMRSETLLRATKIVFEELARLQIITVTRNLTQWPTRPRKRRAVLSKRRRIRSKQKCNYDIPWSPP